MLHIFIPLLVFSTASPSSITTRFLSDLRLDESDTSGVNTILLRLAFEFRDRPPDEETVQLYQWEVDTHLWLQSASFPSVGHFHLHQGHKAARTEASSIADYREHVGVLAILLPLLRAMPGPLSILEVAESDGMCPLLDTLRKLDMRQILPGRDVRIHRELKLQCLSDRDFQVPDASIDAVLVHSPAVALDFEWKLKVGGVAIGTGITQSRDIAAKVVSARRFNELYFAPGDVFWWYRF